jgi:RsiW-degrading membrane proteinase PrsW (M82 family)
MVGNKIDKEVINSFSSRKHFFMENERHCVIPLHKPTRKELAFFFASGILVSIPFALVFEQLSSFISIALSIVILAPFIEELAKVFPLFYRHGETERSIVTLGILIGLGFGISELALYVFLAGTPLIDRIPGVIFHASSAGITGYGIAKKNPLPYYLIAAILHVTNNFFALEAAIPFGIFVEIIVLFAAYLLAWRLYHQASKEKIVV